MLPDHVLVQLCDDLPRRHIIEPRFFVNFT
jgi:hypothetical protein